MTTHEKQLKIGVGEAILRLIHVETLYGNGVFQLPDALKSERALLVESLNQFQLDLNMDCNNDGTPDTVAILKQSAETSCCRILPKESTNRIANTSRRLR